MLTQAGFYLAALLADRAAQILAANAERQSRELHEIEAWLSNADQRWRDALGEEVARDAS